MINEQVCYSCCFFSLQGGFDPAEYYRQQQQQMLLQASQHVEQTREEIQRAQEQVAG